jgi:hypothetical protein
VPQLKQQITDLEQKNKDLNAESQNNLLQI